MDPVTVPLTAEIAKRMGFINLDALKNHQRRRLNAIGMEDLLQQVCNLEQMVLDTKKHVERLEAELHNAGIMRIG